MLFGSGGEGHGNLMTKTATENGVYTAAEEIDPETGEIFDPPKDGYSVFTVDLALDDKSISLTTSQITGSQTAVFEYDPHDENPELEGYSLFTIDLSAVKTDIEAMQQQIAGLEDEIEQCHDCWENVVAALQQYDPTYDPAEGECPSDKVDEVVDKVGELEEQVEECDQCKADVIAKLQEYDPDFDPQTCTDIPPEIDKVAGYELPIPPIPPVNPDDPDPFPFIGSNKVTDEDLNASITLGCIDYDTQTFQPVVNITYPYQKMAQSAIQLTYTSGGVRTTEWYAVSGVAQLWRTDQWQKITSCTVESDGTIKTKLSQYISGNVYDFDGLPITKAEYAGYGDPSHTYKVRNT